MRRAIDRHGLARGGVISDACRVKRYALLPLLLMTATTLTTAKPAPADARQLADTLAQIDLRNGCVPKAAAFVHRYLLDHPKETGNLYFLTLADDRGGEDGHAVALFTHEQQMWIYDYELGVMPTQIAAANFDWRSAQKTVAKLLRERLREAVAARRMEKTPIILPVAPSCEEQVLAASAMLSRTMKVAVIKTGRDSRSGACAWDLVGRVWVYSPEHGTAWATPDGQRSYEQLVGEALGKFGVREAFELFNVRVRGGGGVVGPAG
jgi:hypothetical protein